MGLQNLLQLYLGLSFEWKEQRQKFLPSAGQTALPDNLEQAVVEQCDMHNLSPNRGQLVFGSCCGQECLTGMSALRHELALTKSEMLTSFRKWRRACPLTIYCCRRVHRRQGCQHRRYWARRPPGCPPNLATATAKIPPLEERLTGPPSG